MNSKEDLRQLEHLAPIGFAFLLPYLPFWGVLALSGLAILHALILSPRLIRVTTRPEESRGKLYYALGVLALILIFRNRLDIAAGVWAYLAVGDSASNFFGRRWGVRKLPYNSSKSFVGVLSFWLFGSTAAFAAAWWNRPPSDPISEGLLLGACLTAGLFCAVGESLPDVIDDNLAVVWIGALTLPAALQGLSGTFDPQGDLLPALVVTVTAAVAARHWGWISWRGTALASLFGVLVYSALGPPAFLALLSFVVVGSTATRAGFAQKRRRRISQGEKGERGLSNVAANGLVPVAAAVFALGGASETLKAAFLAAVATAAFDTVATEIGQWLGRRTYHPRTFRLVPRGTPGAVSLEGTLAGTLGALTVAIAPWPFEWLSFSTVLMVWAAAVAAGMWESLVSSGLQQRAAYADEALNLLSTLFGAAAAVLLVRWVGC